MKVNSYLINDPALGMPIEVSLDETKENAAQHYIVTQNDQLLLITAEAAKQLYRAVRNLESING